MNIEYKDRDEVYFEDLRAGDLFTNKFWEGSVFLKTETYRDGFGERNSVNLVNNELYLFENVLVSKVNGKVVIE